MAIIGEFGSATASGAAYPNVAGANLLPTGAEGQAQSRELYGHIQEHAYLGVAEPPVVNSGMIIFGDGSGDSLGNSLRPQDHIVITPLVSATLTSATVKKDTYGTYYEIVATGAAGSSSGYIEFEIGYDQQQFQADRAVLSAEFNPVNVMSIACYLGVLSNYTVNANQSISIAAGTNGAFNGRMSLEFRNDNWTKVGFANAMELQNFKRMRFYFVLRQAQPVTIKIREARAGLGPKKGRLAIVADDYFHSFLRRGVPVLSKRGLVSSMAIIPDQIGNLTGAATLNELQRYYGDGNECVIHGPSGNTSGNWFTTPYTTLKSRMDDVRKGRDYILSNGVGSIRSAACVCYPQGEWQSGSYETTFLSALISDGFKLGRSTGTAGPNGRYFTLRYMRSDSHARFTLPTIGHSYAGVANTSGDATETANIATLLTYVQAIADQGIDGIITFHSIVDDGAANQTYHCEINRLIALADGIKTIVDTGALEVVKLSAMV